MSHQNSKIKLNELSLKKFKVAPTYDTPGKEPPFQSTVKIGHREYTGEVKMNKAEAEQSAAGLMYTHILHEFVHDVASKDAILSFITEGWIKKVDLSYEFPLTNKEEFDKLLREMEKEGDIIVDYGGFEPVVKLPMKRYASNGTFMANFERAIKAMKLSVKRERVYTYIVRISDSEPIWYFPTGMEIKSEQNIITSIEEKYAEVLLKSCVKYDEVLTPLLIEFFIRKRLRPQGSKWSMLPYAATAADLFKLFNVSCPEIIHAQSPDIMLVSEDKKIVLLVEIGIGDSELWALEKYNKYSFLRDIFAKSTGINCVLLRLIDDYKLKLLAEATGLTLSNFGKESILMPDMSNYCDVKDFKIWLSYILVHAAASKVTEEFISNTNVK